MSNPLSMFHDDDGQWSMTRCVAFLFAVSYCTVLNKNATNVHLMGYPFMWLGVATLLAVPLQAFFRYLQEWFSSSPSQKLLGSLISKVTGTSLSTVVKTEVATHSDEDKK